jgi:hypothetical protein
MNGLNQQISSWSRTVAWSASVELTRYGVPDPGKRYVEEDLPPNPNLIVGRFLSKRLKCLLGSVERQGI